MRVLFPEARQPAPCAPPIPQSCSNFHWEKKKGGGRGREEKKKKGRKEGKAERPQPSIALESRYRHDRFTTHLTSISAMDASCGSKEGGGGQEERGGGEKKKKKESKEPFQPALSKTTP